MQQKIENYCQRNKSARILAEIEQEDQWIKVFQTLQKLYDDLAKPLPHKMALLTVSVWALPLPVAYDIWMFPNNIHCFLLI